MQANSKLRGIRKKSGDLVSYGDPSVTNSLPNSQAKHDSVQRQSFDLSPVSVNSCITDPLSKSLPASISGSGKKHTVDFLDQTYNKEQSVYKTTAKEHFAAESSLNKPILETPISIEEVEQMAAELMAEDPISYEQTTEEQNPVKQMAEENVTVTEVQDQEENAEVDQNSVEHYFYDLDFVEQTTDKTAEEHNNFDELAAEADFEHNMPNEQAAIDQNTDKQITEEENAAEGHDSLEHLLYDQGINEIFVEQTLTKKTAGEKVAEEQDFFEQMIDQEAEENQQSPGSEEENEQNLLEQESVGPDPVGHSPEAW